ncbi:hypothetical protein B0H10DRAFT_2243101 [Mycena sp. CBHHK59/15]|nr:hypothetical protein B0H10DRAFT_2243101 [Mycena sp. CBHHK59/15]
MDDAATEVEVCTLKRGSPRWRRSRAVGVPRRRVVTRRARDGAPCIAKHLAQPSVSIVIVYAFCPAAPSVSRAERTSRGEGARAHSVVGRFHPRPGETSQRIASAHITRLRGTTPPPCVLTRRAPVPRRASLPDVRLVLMRESTGASHALPAQTLAVLEAVPPRMHVRSCATRRPLGDEKTAAVGILSALSISFLYLATDINAVWLIYLGARFFRAVSYSLVPDAGRRGEGRARASGRVRACVEGMRRVRVASQASCRDAASSNVEYCTRVYA